jgi:hypothetical protein
VPKINRVEIENYKSIERVDFEARRVNVFIGGPNAGKSNIMEALGMVSVGTGSDFKSVVRARHVGELIRDCATDVPASLRFNSEMVWKLEFERNHGAFCLTDSPNDGGINQRCFPAVEIESAHAESWKFPIRMYVFRSESFGTDDSEISFPSLSAPFGRNLAALLSSDRAFRASVSALFKAHSHRLELRPHSSEILISKQVEDILYSYPFDAISETLRRIVFYKAVLETNRDAVLVLDEPEANTFPFYTKYLAERIALDESNQFFLTTHNPYVLMSIIEKTPATDLAVFVTRMKDYRTQVQPLTGEQLGEALELGMDLFLNLDRYFAD